MQQDERHVLTTRGIENHLCGDVFVAVFALVLTLFYFGLGVLLCCMIPVAFPGGVLSVPKNTDWRTWNESRRRKNTCDA